MTGRLSHKQTAVMVTLMTVGKEIGNPDLHELAGFVLDGQDRVRLNELRLVASRKVGRSYHHVLTDDGWAWCEAELGAGVPPSPRPRSLLAVVAYQVFARMDEYRRREKLRLFELFPAPDDDDEPADVEDLVCRAYDKLARSPRDWVALGDLREHVAAARGDVDAVLIELSRTGRAHLVPESNRKALTAADRAAAIAVGGHDNHLVAIEVP